MPCKETAMNRNLKVNGISVRCLCLPPTPSDLKDLLQEHGLLLEDEGFTIAGEQSDEVDDGEDGKGVPDGSDSGSGSGSDSGSGSGSDSGSGSGSGSGSDSGSGSGSDSGVILALIRVVALTAIQIHPKI